MSLSNRAQLAKERIIVISTIIDHLKTEGRAVIQLTNHIHFTIMKKNEGILLLKLASVFEKDKCSLNCMISDPHSLERAFDKIIQKAGIKSSRAYKYDLGNVFECGLMFPKVSFLKFLRRLTKKILDDEQLYTLIDDAIMSAEFNLMPVKNLSSQAILNQKLRSDKKAVPVETMLVTLTSYQENTPTTKIPVLAESTSSGATTKSFIKIYQHNFNKMINRSENINNVSDAISAEKKSNNKQFGI